MFRLFLFFWGLRFGWSYIRFFRGGLFVKLRVVFFFWLVVEFRLGFEDGFGFIFRGRFSGWLRGREFGAWRSYL